MARISDSLNVRLRMIEELGKLYWGDYGYAQKRNFIAARKDWKTALELFLRNYAFQRLRGFPRYSNAAIQAFKNVARKSVRPPRNVTTAVWKKFLEILELPNDGHGANKKVNPMVPTREGGKRPLLSFISALENHVYNIVSWAEYMLRNGKAAAAFAELESVRGISQKIGTFFLRDVTMAFAIPESAVGDTAYLQPVDTWVGKAAKVLLPSSSPCLEKGDWGIADGLALMAQQAGVNGCLLNAGLWLLGTEMVESDKYEHSLRSPKNLAQCFAEYVEEANHWSTTIDRIVALVDR